MVRNKRCTALMPTNAPDSLSYYRNCSEPNASGARPAASAARPGRFTPLLMYTPE